MRLILIIDKISYANLPFTTRHKNDRFQSFSSFYYDQNNKKLQQIILNKNNKAKIKNH